MRQRRVLVPRSQDGVVGDPWGSADAPEQIWRPERAPFALPELRINESPDEENITARLARERPASIFMDEGDHFSFGRMQFGFLHSSVATQRIGS